MHQARFSYLLLRLGAAFAFLYPPVSALFEPYNWIGYFPSFARGYVDEMVMLHAFGIVEVIIAIWILSGWKIFWPSIAATMMLVAIVAFNWSEFPVLFRDLSIAAMTFSLAIINMRKPASAGASE